MINRNACFAYFNKSWGIPVSNDFLTGGGASNMILLDRQGAELRGWTVLFITWDLPWAAGPEPA